jgi:hypothetical protein
MDRDNPDGITHSIEVLSVFRGLYKRVAVQLDVDPSYVSRVARGQRQAPLVAEALRKEIQRVLGKVGLHNGDGRNQDHDHAHGTMGASLDGHSSNGRAAHAHPPAAPSRDSASPNGHHVRTRKKKTKARTAKPATSKRKS